MEGINGRRDNNNDMESFKLFGVSIALSKREEEEEGIKKSFSMGDLERRSCTNNVSSNEGLQKQADDGYVSDGMVHRERSSSRNSSRRKKGLPWTEDEHRLFLCGLKKLGSGNWRGISKEFVKTRTSTQVASHAQKYFLRKASNDKIKRRASVFDLQAEASTSLSSSEAAQPQELPAQYANRITSKNPQMMKNLLPYQAPLSQVLALSPTVVSPYIAGSDVHHQRPEEASRLGKVIFAPVINYPRPNFAYLNQGNVSCAQMDQWLKLGRNRVGVNHLNS